MDIEHSPTGKYSSQVSWPLIAYYGRILTIYSAQSRELQALLAGQIARALAVFCVDEVVIYDDGQFQAQNDPSNNARHIIDHQQSAKMYTGYTDPDYFLAHILSYLESPPYLRKSLFPMHPDLQHAGMLPSLDMPHHLKKTEWCQYREGVTKSAREGQDKKSNGDVHRMKTLVHTGLSQNVWVEGEIPENTRVTVKYGHEEEARVPSSDTIIATPVAPSAPREEAGFYWGYSVRAAKSLSAVLTECSFDGGYDLTFGTSERGKPISELQNADSKNIAVPNFKHMMIVFGGVAGLEVAVEADDELKKIGVTTPESMFDYWVNLVPGQGSRTIRTEEAVWLGLMGLREIAVTRGRS